MNGLMERRMTSLAFLAFILCLSLGAAAQSNGSGNNPQATGTVSNQQAGTTTTTTSTSTNFIPAGTTLAVRVNDNLSSESTQEGTQFAGTLAADLTTSDGRVIFARGSDVTGHVITVQPSGRISDSGELDLTISTIRSGSQSADIRVTPFVIKGQSHTRSNTEKIGGGAALGAIIGAIAGGGKGAAIGAGVGAGAGGVGAAATGKQPAQVQSEAVLQFTTSTDANVLGASQNSSRPSGSNSGNNSGNQELHRHTDGPNAMINDVHPRRATGNTNDSNYSNSNTSNCAADVRSFSARDRRVVNGCFADNPGSFRSDQSGNNSNSNNSNYSDQPVKNQTLPYSLQNKVRSLAIACERQLTPLPNDLERVYYNKQVMLLDSSRRVLDVFTVNTP